MIDAVNKVLESEVQEQTQQQLDEAKDTQVKDKNGKVVSWKHEGDWKKSTKKDPSGTAPHLSDVARRKTEKMAKESEELHSDLVESESVDRAKDNLSKNKKIIRAEHNKLIKQGYQYKGSESRDKPFDDVELSHHYEHPNGTRHTMSYSAYAPEWNEDINIKHTTSKKSKVHLHDHLKENSPFDWKGKPSELGKKLKKPGESAGFDSKKISTGTVYTRKAKPDTDDKKKVDEAQFWGNDAMRKAMDNSGESHSTIVGKDEKGSYTAKLVRKKGESEHKEVSREYHKPKQEGVSFSAFKSKLNEKVRTEDGEQEPIQPVDEDKIEEVSDVSQRYTDTLAGRKKGGKDNEHFGYKVTLKAGGKRKLNSGEEDVYEDTTLDKIKDVAKLAHKKIKKDLE